MLHRITNMDYTVENITAGDAEQTADIFSEQTRSWTADGQPGEENGPNPPGGYCKEWECISPRVLWWTKFKKKNGINKILCWNSFLIRKF